MNACVIQQQPVPEQLIGPLHESRLDFDDPSEMRHRFDSDGYLLFRGAFVTADVHAARAEVFRKLEQVGEIRAPSGDGIATGTSARKEKVDDLGLFWQSVSEGLALRHLTHGPRLGEIMAAIFGEPARAHDLMYLRPAAVGRSTRLHYDYPFFAGYSKRILTAWIPLGDVPISDGPLVIVEGSNRFEDLISPIRGHDYQANRSNDAVQQAAYENPSNAEPVSFLRARGARFLTTDFRCGDLLVFSGFSLHGSLDNCSPAGRVRLSCDVRYQPAADPSDDERYFGANPIGSKGAGYADMKGARPLTEPW